MCWEQCVEMGAHIAAIAGAVVSVLVYHTTVKRERQLSTIEAYSKIRDKYSDNLSDEEIKSYLKEMEFLCVGINQKIYSFNILRKMSGRRLLDIYLQKTRKYIEHSRVTQSSNAWSEYERVMLRLQRYYSSKKTKETERK